ncbi:MAG TPA: malto-oligosyltrehalose synthase [Candidatus Dormibacteraeota bacterium]|nr:malto-oligosyltrehalose synthase [Candidatus Dormibacteraeota bacterium]
MPRRATYRVQLRGEFGFAEAAAQADYLAALGVSHLYCSPYTQAAQGSTHGYDVVDPTRVSDELGGPVAHQRFTQELREHGLGQVLDIVPNHMSVADRGNRWWWDVLADGISSPYARFFDIDWEADEPRLRHRVLLPLLADQVGRVLEEGQISLVRVEGDVLVAYADHRFPLSLESLAHLLAEHPSGAVASWRSAVAALPAADDAAARRARFEVRRDLLGRLADLLADEDVAGEVDRILALCSGDVAKLDRLLNEQHYRLARWQTALEEVNYRRFFDITTLVGLRIEDPVVFAESSALVAELVRRGDADGVRIDHIDGLRRPLEYAARLRETLPPPTWMLAEKILARGEQPPPWTLDGTSGYDFLAMVNGLFVDPGGRAPLEALHTEFTGNTSDFTACARDGKRDVLRASLLSDVERLTGLLATVCDAYPAQRDHTHSELHEAIVELIVAMPVYRTYVDPSRGPASDVDARIVRGAAAEALNGNPHIDGRLLDFIGDLFVSGEPEEVATSDTSPLQATQRDFLFRVQQLCAAATAKGVEDTAFYRHLVLTSLNEVGDSPAHFGVSGAEFHEHNRLTQDRRPHTLLATSTHDTKRSEDVRARINLLSELPDAWATAVQRWHEHNHVHRRGEWPDRAMEYLLYQTLVGAWPISADRVVGYMRKASREAKQHTSWLQPDDAYDSALAAFAASIVDDAWFVADLQRLVATLAPHGSINSLSATLLKLTSPGVPDIYQGTELWDFSLVDPDNRRRVDYALRRRLLDEAQGRPLSRTWPAGTATGTAKIGLIATGLALRGRRDDAFDERGAYAPVWAQGEFADDVVAFTRGDPACVVSLAQRRSLRRQGRWGDTVITLPEGRWDNLCGSREHRGTVLVGDLLEAFPVAVLERVA